MPEVVRSAGDGVVVRAVLFWLGDQCCAIAADRIVKVIPAQQLTLLPFLPPGVPGVIAVGGKVVPVIELRTMLDLPEGDHTDGELMLLAINTEAYALRVDRVLQIAAAVWTTADLWRGMRVRLIDIDDLLERRLRGGTAARMAWASLELAESVPTGPQQAPTLGIRGAALAVETANSHDLLPLDVVVELRETLPIVAVPDPVTIFAGAAFYRDALVPVISLDVLLGRAPTSKDAWGSFVVVEVEDRRCALAVKRVVGLSPEPDLDRVVQLRPLLTKLLPQSESGSVLIMPQGAQAQGVEALAAETLYLLVELAGRICAFALASVAHLHAECRVVKAPAEARSATVGVTAIGGRVLPVLDLGALLGFNAGAVTQQFVELKSEETGAFVVAVDRVVGIAAIGQDALVPPPEDTAISAIARLGSNLVWILAASLIAERGSWRRDAA